MTFFPNVAEADETDPDANLRADLEPVPLSLTQQEILLRQELLGSAIYNIGLVVRIEEPLRIDLLEQSIRDVIAAEPMLRAVVSQSLAQPAWRIAADLGWTLPYTDWTAQPDSADDAEQKARRAITELKNAGIDPEELPLWRFALHRVGPQRHDCVLCFNHIMLDGYGVLLVGQRIMGRYNDLASGKPAALKAGPHFRRLIERERAYRQSPRYAQDRVFWESRFPPPAAPPFRNATAEVQALTAPIQSRWLVRRPQWQKFVDLAARFDLSPAQAAIFLLATYLAKITDAVDVVVGLPVHNRKDVADKQTIGLFTTVLPLRLQMKRESRLSALMQATAAETRQILHHRQYPLDRLLMQQSSRQGIAGMHFDLMVSIEDFDPHGSIGSARQTYAPFSGHPAIAPIAAYVRNYAETQDLPIDFVIDARSPAALTSTEFLPARLDRLLAAFLDNPDQSLGELNLLSGTERDTVLDAFNRTARAHAEPLLMHRLVSKQVQRTPQSTAVRFGDRTLSYAALDNAANALAHTLRERGVGPNSLLPVCMERSPELVVALLGVLKAGAAYVPLDPDLPPDRLRRILQDCGAALILTQARLRDRLSAARASPEVDILECDDLATSGPTQDAPPSNCTPDDLAFVIFTSGSTGQPKGVMISHRAMCNHKLWNARVLNFGPDDRVLQKTTISFDASVWEIFVPLMTGSQVILAEPGLQRDLPALLRTVIADGITHLTLAPSTARALLDEPDLPACTGLRCLLFGGEPFDAALAARIQSLLPQVKILNFYGPSETTEDCSLHVVDGMVPPTSGTLPIGRPIDNTRIYVLDEAMQPVPIGVAGELYVAGMGVAQGYLGRPDLTAERFLPDPFAPEGGRMYKTGDLGCWLPDGRLTYIGRNDDQVKIRGFRVEPGEIERQLCSHPGVTQAAVTSWDAGGGDIQLAAYVAVHPDAPQFGVAEFRRYLQSRLPHYMIPAAWKTVPAMPLTPSGKIDKRSLPPPEIASGIADAPLIAPRTPTEHSLWEIWRDVLETVNFGVLEHFFDLGGHSLTLTQVRSRIRVRIGLDLPLVDLFRHMTIADLARHIDASPALASSPAEAIHIARIARGGPLPASLSQRRLWVIQQFDPASSAYNVSVSLRLRGRLDASLLERTLTLLIQRHEGLRTSFTLVGDEPRQIIAPELTARIERLDYSDLPIDQRERLARSTATARSAQPFDLSAPPLHRITLIKLQEDEVVLLWILHHTITDNWALALLSRDALHIYSRLAQGEPDPALSPLQIQYADFAAWQRSAEVTAARQKQVDAWLERLALLPTLALPTDFPRPMHPSFRGGFVSATLALDVRGRLQAYCKQHSVTPFIVLLASFKLMLSRLTQNSDIAVGTPIANRHHQVTEHLFGTLVNTLVLRTEVQDNIRFDSLVQRVRDTAMWAFAHQDAPFDELVERMDQQRADHPQGLVNVLFNVLNAPLGQLAAVPFDYSRFDFDRVAAQFDLSIHIDTEFSHRIQLEYAADLFAPDTAQRLLDGYLYLVGQVLADPARPLSAYALVTPQQQALLRNWNATDSALPATLVAHRYLATAPAHNSAREAVRDVQGHTLRYADLEARSNTLARALRARGIGRGQQVGLSLPRNVDMLAAVLAVFKSGAAYVPLDPTYPRQRLRDMAADAQLAAILIEASLSDLFDAVDVPLLALDQATLTAGHSAAPLPADPARDAQPEDPAYMIYTSGSTGRPKGVQVPHRAVVNFLASMARAPGMRAGDVLLAVTTLSFDISVLELLLPLAVGARVVLASHTQTRDPHALRALLEGSGATVMQATPST